jgi:branched-chain amino acid transport system substrate-binding protein
MSVCLFATLPARAETGVTKDTIKIGMFGPLTGPVSIFGYPINDGSIAIYKEVNDQGGIYGRKIEVIDEDDGCDPAKSRAAIKKLIDRDEVFLLHGGSCSAAVFAARDIFIEEEVPFMTMSATMDKISIPTSHFIFTAVPTGSVDGASMARFVASIPEVKKVAMVHHTDEWAAAKVDAIRKVIKERNLDLVADEVMDRNATDATAQVLKIKDAKPDVTFFVTYPGESAVFLRDAHKYGLEGPFVGSNSVTDLDDLATRSGGLDVIKNVYAGAYLKGPVDSPEMKPYADLVRKYFPNDKIQSLPFYGMAGAYAIVAALKKAGPDLTREKFIAALESLRDNPAGPSFCDTTFSAEDHVGCKAEQMWTMRDGHIVAVGQSWPGGPLR